MTLTDLVSTGEVMREGLGREHNFTGAGHKSEPVFQEVYDRYGIRFGDEALEVVRERGSLVLFEWLMELA